MPGASGQQIQDVIGGQNWLARYAGPQGVQQNKVFGTTQGQVLPFYRNMMLQGLPEYRSMTDYARGDIAQQFAPARADILRRTGNYMNMPSGYRDALLRNFDVAKSRAFDSSLRQAMMAQAMARQQGAAGLQGEQQIAGNNALANLGMVNAANQSILGGPVKPGKGGIVGGLVSAGLTAAASL